MMDPILYEAVREGKVEVVEQQNPDQLHVQLTPNNNTVLHVATQFGNTRCVKMILQKCGRSLLCSVNIKGEIDSTSHFSEGRIHPQALIEHAETVKDDQDLESGTRVTKEMMLRTRNVEGDTALYGAVRNNHPGVVEILTKEDPQFLHFPNNATESPLYLGAERGYPAIVSKILKNCISPAYIGPNGRTAFHAATICCNKECIRILYEWKPTLSKEADVYGWRPLHYAALVGDVSTVCQLLDLDKSMAYLVTDKDDNMTAHHIAASQGHVKVVKELLSRCPDCWEMINSSGQNILHIAAKYDNDKDNIINFILANPIYSSLINQKDINGNTPFHLVVSSGGNLWLHPLYLEPRVNRSDYNNKNLTAFEIEDKNMRPNQVAKVGRRNKFQLKKTSKEGDQKQIADTHLIVATLIGTVTFAAAFTVPGGYDGDDGPKQGMAVLLRSAAFKAFVVTDAIAMVSSITVVYLHLSASFYADKGKRERRYACALWLILAAMGAMVVAFTTGFYAVLAPSSGLAITVCVICCFFFPILYLVFKKLKRDLVD